MGPPKRNLLATIDETLTPPNKLEGGHVIARIVKAAGKNLYAVDLSSGDAILVEMPARFRSTIWVKRGTFVVVDTDAYAERENKLGGEIVNIVRDEKQWRKESYWYFTFVCLFTWAVDSITTGPRLLQSLLRWLTIQMTRKNRTWERCHPAIPNLNLEFNMRALHSFFLTTTSSSTP